MIDVIADGGHVLPRYEFGFGPRLPLLIDLLNVPKGLLLARPMVLG